MSRLVHDLPDESTMRRAVAERNVLFDDRFVYGVVTTGVFCRPSCASRPARPENLRFFADVQPATEAGFRPCRRCRPDEPAGDVRAMVALARRIESASDDRLTLEQLAEWSGMSQSRLQRRFMAVFGVTPKVFHEAARRDEFKVLLRQGLSVTDAGMEAGYGSSSRVHHASTRSLGMPPSVYQRGGQRESIGYAVRITRYGALMMAATDRGVCFVQFGDDEASLLLALQDEFPKAELIGSPSTDRLEQWVSALEAHLDHRAPRPDLPLDLRGTAFQLVVWRFLQTVPEGEVVSYRDVAQGVGRPKAIRAAASACAANRIAVLVPCHRVLRQNGELGGYRWGVERKRALVEAEGG